MFDHNFTAYTLGYRTKREKIIIINYESYYCTSIKTIVIEKLYSPDNIYFNKQINKNIKMQNDIVKEVYRGKPSFLVLI